VTVDRSIYGPGEEVVIYVSATGIASSERLWLYVDEPDGHNLCFTELTRRGGIIVVTLPQDAADGLYTVTVTWDHQYIQTGFTVERQPIPEFPSAAITVLILAASVASATLLRRKAGASAETLAAHP
jgi:hypothetical protein